MVVPTSRAERSCSLLCWVKTFKKAGRLHQKSHNRCTAHLKKSIPVYCLLCSNALKRAHMKKCLCMFNFSSGLSSQYCIALFKRTDLLITISWLFILCCSAAFSKQFQYANQNRLWPYESHCAYFTVVHGMRHTLVLVGRKYGGVKQLCHFLCCYTSSDAKKNFIPTLSVPGGCSFLWKVMGSFSLMHVLRIPKSRLCYISGINHCDSVIALMQSLVRVA